jgi:hypothetical protein
MKSIKWLCTIYQVEIYMKSKVNNNELTINSIIQWAGVSGKVVLQNQSM